MWCHLCHVYPAALWCPAQRIYCGFTLLTLKFTEVKKEAQIQVVVFSFIRNFGQALGLVSNKSVIFYISLSDRTPQLYGINAIGDEYCIFVLQFPLK